VPPADKEEERRLRLGADVYAGACARCHDAGRGIGSEKALQMPLAVAVYDPDPRSLIHIVREGIYPPSGEQGRRMPGFAGVLTDEQTVALLTYLRRYAADAPPWPDLDSTIQKVASP
jgi:mono/diheme cytochrome c family protein